jgi:hypothetical protein
MWMNEYLLFLVMYWSRTPAGTILSLWVVLTR